jgi:membrane protease subunit (stomatin/prohibitin family)
MRQIYCNASDVINWFRDNKIENSLIEFRTHLDGTLCLICPTIIRFKRRIWMGIIQAFTGAIGGTFADQWKAIITASHFNEHTVVSPGILKQSEKVHGSNSVISNGSKIYIPENTSAFIFSQSGIEEIITSPGGYEYQNGQKSIFNGDGITNSILKQVRDRIGFGGQTSDQKQIAFVNLREIRGIKFGTKGPLVYNDLFYGTDLEILAFGSFSLKIVDAEKFIRNFLPPNVNFYSFDDRKAREQVLSEFLQSFVDALNSLSIKYRISQLPSQANEIAAKISDANSNAGTWKNRFGFEIVKVGIENIEFSPESRELVRQYSSNRMNLKAFEDISQRTSNIAAQQKIAKGIQENGLGNGAGMIFGMNMALGLNPQNASQIESKTVMSFDEQIEAVKKLKELLDARKGLLFVAFYALFFGFILFMVFTEENETVTKESGHLFWKKTIKTTIHHDLSERIPYLIGAIVLLLVAVVCTVIALRLTQLSRKYKKYLTIINGNDKLLIQQVADINNSNPRRVMNDLQNMIDSNYIKGYYIDYKQGLLLNKNYIPEKFDKKIVKCQSCGASNEVVIEQSNYCKYCDSLIIL